MADQAVIVCPDNNVDDKVVVIRIMSVPNEEDVDVESRKDGHGEGEEEEEDVADAMVQLVRCRLSLHAFLAKESRYHCELPVDRYTDTLIETSLIRVLKNDIV